MQINYPFVVLLSLAVLSSATVGQQLPPGLFNFPNTSTVDFTDRVLTQVFQLNAVDRQRLDAIYTKNLRHATALVTHLNRQNIEPLSGSIERTLGEFWRTIHSELPRTDKFSDLFGLAIRNRVAGDLPKHWSCNPLISKYLLRQFERIIRDENARYRKLVGEKSAVFGRDLAAILRELRRVTAKSCNNRRRELRRLWSKAVALLSTTNSLFWTMNDLETVKATDRVRSVVRVIVNYTGGFDLILIK